MKLIYHLLHIAFPKLCSTHLYWKNDVLVCRKCGEVAATRYLFDGRIRVLVFDTYECLREEIMARADNADIACDNDVIGEVAFVDWEDFKREELRKIQSIDIQMPETKFSEEEDSVLQD